MAKFNATLPQLDLPITQDDDELDQRDEKRMLELLESLTGVRKAQENKRKRKENEKLKSGTLATFCRENKSVYDSYYKKWSGKIKKLESRLQEKKQHAVEIQKRLQEKRKRYASDLKLHTSNAKRIQKEIQVMLDHLENDVQAETQARIKEEAMKASNLVDEKLKELEVVLKKIQREVGKEDKMTKMVNSILSTF